MALLGTTEIIHNPSYETLFEEETKAGLEGYEVGVRQSLVQLTLRQVSNTGRFSKDKYIVMDENSK